MFVLITDVVVFTNGCWHPEWGSEVTLRHIADHLKTFYNMSVEMEEMVQIPSALVLRGEKLW